MLASCLGVSQNRFSHEAKIIRIRFPAEGRRERPECPFGHFSGQGSFEVHVERWYMLNVELSVNEVLIRSGYLFAHTAKSPMQ